MNESMINEWDILAGLGFFQGVKSSQVRSWLLCFEGLELGKVRYLRYLR